MSHATVLRGVLVALPDSALLETRDFVLAGHGRSGSPHTIDLKDHAVLPALANAHDHLHLNAIPPLPVTQIYSNSYAWASAYATHFGDAQVQRALGLSKELRHWQGALKNALCGVTTVMHHDPTDAVFDRPGFPVRIVKPYGWAHSLHWQYGPQVRQSFESTPPDVAWFIHLGEGTDQITADELQELRSHDCLKSNTVLIHGVAIDDDGIEQIIRCGASVVWCPTSNLTILGRTIDPPRVRKLFAARRLALGTDSRLSGSTDLLQELRVAAQHSDLSARELLQTVSVHARTLLRVGPAPDDVIIYRRASGDPFQDLLRLKRHELRAVVRDGEPLIADPDLEAWFVAKRIPFAQIFLDGHPKLCARSLLPGAVLAERSLEPGLTA